MRRSGLTFAALAGLIAVLGITPAAAGVAPPTALPDPRPWTVDGMVEPVDRRRRPVPRTGPASG